MHIHIHKELYPHTLSSKVWTSEDDDLLIDIMNAHIQEGKEKAGIALAADIFSRSIRDIHTRWNQLINYNKAPANMDVKSTIEQEMALAALFDRGTSNHANPHLEGMSYTKENREAVFSILNDKNNSFLHYKEKREQELQTLQKEKSDLEDTNLELQQKLNEVIVRYQLLQENEYEKTLEIQSYKKENEQLLSQLVRYQQKYEFLLQFVGI